MQREGKMARVEIIGFFYFFLFFFFSLFLSWEEGKESVLLIVKQLALYIFISLRFSS